jgi:hypothetical protein
MLQATKVNHDGFCVIRPALLNRSRGKVRMIVMDLGARSSGDEAARRARPRVPHVMLNAARSL